MPDRVRNKLLDIFAAHGSHFVEPPTDDQILAAVEQAVKAEADLLRLRDRLERLEASAIVA